MEKLDYDILPRIYRHEEHIMNSWIVYFKSIKSKYAITDHVDVSGKPYKTLWKQGRV